MTAVNRSHPARAADQVAAAVADTAELLEILFERARDASPRPLSVSQVRAVVALDRYEGLNLRTLAELLGSTPPLASRLCDRLEAVGFLERLPHSRNRRELVLRLSDSGRAYLQDLRARRRERLHAVLAALTDGERAGLATGLRAFQAAANRDLAERDNRAAAQ
ncbi:MarR family transcriptional regulator [Amycolatopsis australiensis]|uniref:DNA-binding transcriptional regulator, MarR family n=1 Tax=Amycolatopsis australiensis TaxID=546364 RepID=A0A1K1R6L5_9PSEU|nr:MarR family transcriptional regulator [Amycolatopsis australiensis]SFW67561.1 DNA-binding transcriptional regulator, MarR family [Amycolatopsis australiensis]